MVLAYEPAWTAEADIRGATIWYSPALLSGILLFFGEFAVWTRLSAAVSAPMCRSIFSTFLEGGRTSLDTYLARGGVGLRLSSAFEATAFCGD